MSDADDYANIIRSDRVAASSTAIGNLDSDPEEGARAVELAKASGSPVGSIIGDVDGFDKEYKSYLAGNLIKQNSHLQAYINSSPAAPIVSADDYANLDAASTAASRLKKLFWAPTNVIEKGIVGGWGKFKEGYGWTSDQGPAPMGSWISPEDQAAHPFAASIASVAAAPVELPFRLLSGIFSGGLGAIHGALTESAESLGASPGSAERFAREVTGKVEMQLMGGGVHAPEIPPAVIDAVRAARPWLEQGVEPPRGVHPEIDKFKADRNVSDLKALDEALSESTASATRERAPDMYAGFMRQHLGEAKIGISGEKVAELYGEKLPTPDDNKLGWVPGIAEQIEAAKATGQDIQVPIADWLAKVDPAIAKELHDDIRVQPGNITKAEKEVETIKSAAVKIGDQIFEGQLHSDAYEKAGKELGQNIENTGEGGFITSTGRYVGRKEALSIAERQGQDKRLGSRDKYTESDKELLAEDLQTSKTPSYVESPLAQVRGAASLEPMFSIGDRKLSLERFGDTVKGYENFHDFQLVDENQRKVGVINISTQKGGKQLYVEGIEGLNGLGPRDFGPSLMRDILRQLKAEFPEAETITGHRVSGARDKAGTYNAPSAQPVVKLDNIADTDVRALHDSLTDAYWHRFSQSLHGAWKPTELYTKHEAELSKVVNEELARIVPKKVDVQDVVAIDAGTYAKKPSGSYIQSTDKQPTILWSLNSTDPIGVARHEAIHHLRQYGFFTDAEWGTLEKASKDLGWVDERIKENYSQLDIAGKTEEGVAEAFRAWAKDREAVPKPVDTIFQKIKDLLTAIGKRFREILGHEPTWEELFESVHKGEIGSREGGEPLNPAAMRLSMEDRADMLRANATGLDLKSFQRLQKLIEQRHAEDYEAALKRSQREQAKTQTAEWKAQSAEIRPKVVEDIKSRPDIAADEFLRTGDFFGKKVDKAPRLRADDLSPEQIASLPKSYVAKSGMPIDEVANAFGFTTGDEMVRRLSMLNMERAGRNPDVYRRSLIDAEVQRRMEREHGFLEKNILEEAQDQALSQTQLDILAEEYHAAGMMAKVGTVDANVAKAWAKDTFAKQIVGDVSSDHFMAQMGRYGRDAERALIAGKPAEAVQLMQKKYLNALMAKEAKELERQMDRFDRDAKRLGAREIKNLEPDYLNFIHQILSQVGKPIKRSVQDLAQQIEASGYKNLEGFVQSKTGMLRELPVPEFLYDANFRKPVEQLKVDEFRGVSDAVKALAFNGRDELKIYRAGEAADFNEKKSQMMEQLEDFATKHYDAKGGRWLGPLPPSAAKIIRTYVASHMQLENIFNRFDKFDPKGIWNQYVMRDLIEGANQESAWEKEYAKKLIATDDGANMKKAIDNQIFHDPLGGNLLRLNRGNLRSIILNAGNDSNLKKLASGYKLTPEAVRSWIDAHATKEDWDWAQKIWDMFSEVKERSDTMYRSLTGGVAPESIPIRPVETPHGTYKGGYYPIIFHPEFEGTSKKLLGGDPLEQDNYVRATTPAGYTKARTGYTAPLALDLDALPGRMRSMLHDIALRPAVINASKVMYDPAIRAKIAAQYGTEYKDLLVPYLRDVANSANYNSKAQKLGSQFSEFIRQNMILTLVGLNPGTVLKHGPTAWVQSMHEVGSVNFLRELKSLFSVSDETGDTNWKFAMDTSQELQRRHRNYREALSGAVEELAPTGTYGTLRQNVLKYSSMPVALSDIVSAVPTWLAKYREVMGESGVHGDAVYAADRAVRRAHGSTAITNRPGVMRGTGLSQWFASVYGFFNHIMNRQAEMVWKAGDTLDMVKDGDYKGAMAKVPELTGMLFAYVIAPAVIEELVTPLASTQNESWAKKAAKGIGFTLGASWVGVRDLVSALLNDRDPSVGLLSTAFQTVRNVARDASKDHPLSKEHAGRIIQDGTALFGTVTGLTPLQLGRSARFGYNVAKGNERPKGPWGWLTGLRYGTLDKHAPTFQQWMKH